MFQLFVFALVLLLINNNEMEKNHGISSIHSSGISSSICDN